MGVKNILLACDNFIGTPTWAEAFCDAIILWKEKTGHQPRFYTWLTINLVYHPRLLEKMKLAGFDMFFVGVESFGLDQLLETAKLQNVKTDIVESIRTIQSYGFIVVAGLIFGFDTDPEDAIEVALDGIKRSGLISGDPSLPTALPGTPLYRRMELSKRLRKGKLSYRPPESLPSLIQSFQKIGLDKILIINDGSPKEYEKIFQEVSALNAEVLTSPTNEGKGHALKRGFKHILEFKAEVFHIVTCDDDGQHLPKDVLKLIKSSSGQTKLYLGARSFTGNIPFKSLLGNVSMQALFYLLTGKKIKDTQTGLRCYHKRLLPGLLKCSASGFNYESVILLNLIMAGEPICEIPIETVYFNNNKSTRFKTVLDSVRIIIDLLVRRFKM